MDAAYLRVYRRLLALYPSGLREEHADDMVQVLGDLLRGLPRREQAAVFARAVADLARSAPRERWAAVQAQPAAAGAVVAPGARGRAPAPPSSRALERPSRRDFLRGTLGMAAAGVLSGGTAAVIAYLWPAQQRGFGGLVDAGPLSDLQATVAASRGTLPLPAARAYLVAYDAVDDPDGVYAAQAGGAGLLALYQKCVHLGCRVPFCETSTRFECPCHASRYNRWGEYQSGPAPRGLDRFAVSVLDGRLIVDTTRVLTGPARRVDVLREGPHGPSCLGGV